MSGQNDPHQLLDDGLSTDLKQRLQSIQPTGPDQATLDRVWQQILDRTDDLLEPVTTSLRELKPSDPNPPALNRMWQRIESETQRGRKPIASSPRLAHPPLIRQRRAMVMIAIVLALMLSVSNIASANALPGSLLYPVKRAWEEISMSLTFPDNNRTEFALELSRRRRMEAEQLVLMGASPDLIAQLLADSLQQLDRASSTASPSRITAAALGWQQDIARWPEAYRSGLTSIIAMWWDRHSETPPPTSATVEPTPSATQTVTPTATPTTSTIDPSVIIVPSSLPTDQPIPSIPSVTFPPVTTQPEQTPIVVPSPQATIDTPVAPTAQPLPLPTTLPPTVSAPVPTKQPTLPIPAPTTSLSTVPAPAPTVPLPLPTVLPPLPTISLP